jgi:N-acetyl sugar amidotransferase
MKYCANCLTPETRPRVTFNKQGICNACTWAEIKRARIDWDARWKELEKTCDEYRDEDGLNWDVLVPCSGGKDGSYVAWKLKHELGMHPLCVTLLPQLPTEMGKKNLENFLKTGFDHIAITPDQKVYARLAKKGFIEQGRPKLPFVVGISTVTIRVAMNFGIKLIIYGEEGESEYGGVMHQVRKTKIDRDYLVRYYYSGHDPVEHLDEFTKHELKWWTLPSQEELTRAGIFAMHWSHFENWDPRLHAEFVKDKTGFQSIRELSISTFTNYAQLDDKLQDLHAYLMFIKFGFGRCTSDVGIEIRAGRMSREEGLELVKEYDGIFPHKYLDGYLDYFEMADQEFWKVIDSHANKDVLEKADGKWELKETPH